MFNIRNIFAKAGDTSWDDDHAAFFKAVRKNDAARIRAVAAKYPDCVSWNNGKAPLEIAINCGAEKAFDALLSLNADVDANLGHGKGYPLHEAIAEKRLDLAEKLLAAGARIDRMGVRYGPNGLPEYFTPMAIAIDKGDNAVVAYLLDKGARPHGICLTRELGYGAGDKSFTPLAYAKAQNRLATADFIAHKTLKEAEDPAVAAAAATAPAKASIKVNGPLRLKNRGGKAP